MGTMPNRPATNANMATTTPRVDAIICRVGDAVEAVYKTNRRKYNATIALISGNTITVNWSSGNTRHRSIPIRYAFKHGVSCMGRTSVITEGMPCL